MVCIAEEIHNGEFRDGGDVPVDVDPIRMLYDDPGSTGDDDTVSSILREINHH